jgi:hypothetical protein
MKDFLFENRQMYLKLLKCSIEKQYTSNSYCTRFLELLVNFFLMLYHKLTEFVWRGADKLASLDNHRLTDHPWKDLNR